jgi:hypothetical protein
MSNNWLYKAPLLESLRKIPKDAGSVYQTDPDVYIFTQTGILCHRAADRIEKLDRRIEWLERQCRCYKQAVDYYKNRIDTNTDRQYCFYDTDHLL